MGASKSPFAKIALSFPLILLFFAGCGTKKTASLPAPSDDSSLVIGSILSHRADMDQFFRSSPYSPFVNDPSTHFEGIKWFPPSLAYRFHSRLFLYPQPETVVVLGTKGEERKERRYGYFVIEHEGTSYRLNTYKSIGERDEAAEAPLSVWFTDETTNNETYGVGRYLDLGEESGDPEHLYVLDFNNAYNPYCAYSDRYSCAVPRKEDHLEFPIRAGELKYHP